MAKVIYTDRSRYECGQRCGRERFWNYHYEGDPEVLEAEDVVQGVPGITPERDSLDLLFGSAVHEHVESTQHPVTNAATHLLLNTVSDTETPDGVSISHEYAALYTGLTQVFDRYTVPLLTRDYDFMGAEVESSMLLGENLTWMSRIDGALRRKSDGLWFTLEIKTSSYPEQLLLEASTNFQLLMEVESMRRHYGLKPEQCGGALLLVFNKGRRQRASEKERSQGRDGHRRLSPFTYWYVKDGADGSTQYRLDYRNGWDRRAVWTIPKYLDVAFESFSAELQNQVQLYPSVSFDGVRVASVIEQVMFQERIYAGDESVNARFPQNFKMCNNSGGFKRECSFKALCFSPSVASNPFVSGFEPRSPNHPTELEGEQI